MAEAVTIVQLQRFAQSHLFSIERVYKTVRAHLPATVKAKVWTAPHPSKGIGPRLKDAWAARNLPGDVIHMTGDAHYLLWFARKHRTILTIHDLESLKRMSGWKARLFLLAWYRWPIARSAAIVVISQATKQVLAQYIDLADCRVEVIPNPIPRDIAPKSAPFNAAQPLALHIGTKANKNLERHAQALSGTGAKLFIIGKPNARQISVLDECDLEWESAAGISDDALAALYHKADFLMFASLEEGFGLPILEAQSAAIPVITSNCSSMPEVAGEGALLVDPLDTQAIHHAVKEVLGSAEIRQKLVGAGTANLARYDTTVIAQQYALLYRDIAQV